MDQVDLHWLSAVMFFLAACLGGIRGYEVVWTDLGGLIHDIQCSESKEDLQQYVGQLLDASRWKAEELEAM